MGEQMFRGNLRVDGLKMFVHTGPFYGAARRNATAFARYFAARMCLIPRIGITTQSGRLFNS